MMRFGIRVLVCAPAILVLQGSTITHSQQRDDFCQAIEKLVEESQSNFANIRGPQTREAGGIVFFERPSVGLLAATDCYVSYFPEGGGWQFACTWRSNDRAARRAAYDGMSAASAECFPAARVSSNDRSTTVSLDGARVRVTLQDSRALIALRVNSEE